MMGSESPHHGNMEERRECESGGGLNKITFPLRWHGSGHLFAASIPPSIVFFGVTRRFG